MIRAWSAGMHRIFAGASLITISLACTDFQRGGQPG
jgi:hypothetical protein